MNQVHRGLITIHEANAELDEELNKLDKAHILTHMDKIQQIIQVHESLGQSDSAQTERDLLSYLKHTLNK